jgi:hypothetical protein
MPSWKNYRVLSVVCDVADIRAERYSAASSVAEFLRVEFSDARARDAKQKKLITKELGPRLKNLHHTLLLQEM